MLNEPQINNNGSLWNLKSCECLNRRGFKQQVLNFKQLIRVDVLLNERLMRLKFYFLLLTVSFLPHLSPIHRRLARRQVRLNIYDSINAIADQVSRGW